MLDTSAIVKVAEDAVDRCDHIMSNGVQCRNRAVEGGKKCIIHGGASTLKAQEAQRVRQYKLTKYHNQLDRFRSTETTSLRDEIALLRMSLEEIVNQFTGPADFIINSAKICMIAQRIEGASLATLRLERALGELINRQVMLQIADGLVSIITPHLTEEQMDLVAKQLVELVEKELRNATPEV